jgi:hypothetical protein
MKDGQEGMVEMTGDSNGTDMGVKELSKTRRGKVLLLFDNNQTELTLQS